MEEGDEGVEMGVWSEEGVEVEADRRRSVRNASAGDRSVRQGGELGSRQQNINLGVKAAEEVPAAVDRYHLTPASRVRCGNVYGITSA